jgi:hypothetical protein
VTWTVLWLAWIAAFFAIEVPALLNRQDGDTLSEHVWSWFAVKDKSKKGLVRARRFCLLAGLAWLCAHFLTGGRF